MANTSKHITDELIKRINTFQLLTIAAFLGLTIILVLIKEFTSVFIGIVAVLMLAALITTVITYVWIVFKVWKCPYCYARLPLEYKARGGMSPKTVDTCPFCKKSLLK